ncbi:unnamed protein product [Ectocarpus sp. CCAP 1310/34]|nr:unnamed protein product [Ectocarpus sp. CCAP 1310/34]
MCLEFRAGRIIAATKSYPGSENDKTIIQRDKSIWRIRDEEPWSSLKYKLYNADGSETEYKGAWLVVDGGYQKVKTVLAVIVKIDDGIYLSESRRCVAVFLFPLRPLLSFGKTRIK